MPPLISEQIPIDAKGFSKYEKRGAYHWDYLSKNPRKHNAADKGRYDRVVELASAKGKKILDVGCGDGVLTYLLAQAGGLLSGIDCSEIAIQAAQDALRVYKHLSCQFRVGSAYELPYPDKSFDIVVCSEVIEHVSHPDKLLKEINRVTRTEGYVILTTPCRNTEDVLDPEHIEEFFPKQLQALVAPYLSHTQITLSHPWLFVELYHMKIFGKRFPMVLINLLSILGWNPFLTKDKYKVYHQIFLVAKPKH